MISSAPRLKVPVELVTNASITPSSSPESASLITSATGAVGLTLGGSGFRSDLLRAQIEGAGRIGDERQHHTFLLTGVREFDHFGNRCGGPDAGRQRFQIGSPPRPD